MSQELVYTSAPKGLKPGSKGFCTVAMTAGMTGATVERLESLSGYRALYPLGDARSTRNPINWCHWRVNIQGQPRSVLSRVAFAGADYSQRSNKLAHHIVLEPGEQSPAGPASLLLSGNVARTTWTGEPAQLPTGPSIPNPERPPAICKTWARLTGDAGWAAALADAYLEDPSRPVYLIYPPEAAGDVLQLFEESMSLLPARQRWDVTFSTYFTDLPLGLTCAWRGVVSDQQSAVLPSRQRANVKVIDLSDTTLRSGGDSANALAARGGHGLSVLLPNGVTSDVGSTALLASPKMKGQLNADYQRSRRLNRNQSQTFELEEPDYDEVFATDQFSSERSGSKRRAGTALIAGAVLVAMLLLAYFVVLKVRHLASDRQAADGSAFRPTSQAATIDKKTSTQPFFASKPIDNSGSSKNNDNGKSSGTPIDPGVKIVKKSQIQEVASAASSDNRQLDIPSPLADALVNASATKPAHSVAVEELRSTDVISFHAVSQLATETTSRSEWSPDEMPQAAKALAAIDGLTLVWPDGNAVETLHSSMTTKAVSERQIVLRSHGTQLNLRLADALPVGGFKRASGIEHKEVSIALFQLDGDTLKFTRSTNESDLSQEVLADLRRSTLVGLAGERPVCRLSMQRLEPIPLTIDHEIPVTDYQAKDEYDLRVLTNGMYSSNFRNNVLRCSSTVSGHAAFRVLLDAGRISWTFEGQAEKIGLANVPGLLHSFKLLNDPDAIHSVAAASDSALFNFKDVDANAPLSNAKSQANKYVKLEASVAERKRNKQDKEAAELEAKQSLASGSFAAEREAFKKYVDQRLSALKQCNLPPTEIELQLKANAFPVEHLVLSYEVPVR